MKIIKASVERITETDPLKKIELAGRTCYKSEDKITATSAEKFVLDKVKLGHESVIEHANFILEVDSVTYSLCQSAIKTLQNCGFNSMIRMTAVERYIMSGNARMWRDFFKKAARYNQYLPNTIYKLVEDNPVLFGEYINHVMFKDTERAKPIKYLTNADLTYKETFIHACETFKITCDRGVTHELVRHRTASFSQESTRYCNYSKGKYGSEITVIKPCYWDERSAQYATWVNAMQCAEDLYLTLINNGASAQEARAVLPNSLKTELIMTANLEEWHHILELRCDKAAHPQCREVCNMIPGILLDDYPALFGTIVEAR